MGISLKPEHLKRYKDIALLLVKYGRADLVKSAGLDATIEGMQDVQVSPAKMEELAADVEKMGPTFIKLAQLLSTRADLLPQPYIDALTRLQDKVEPFPFTEVEQIVNTELGVRISKAFSEFQSEPVAAASLGQVHRAALRNGRDVVVKVQRPGIREEMSKDLDVLADIADFLDSHTEVGRKFEFSSFLEEFRKSLLHELDYRLEARNLLERQVSDDRRVKGVRLTSGGLALKHKLEARLIADHPAVRGLSSTDRQTLLAILRRLD